MTTPDRYGSLISWLLEGDPSIRYQTLRDLVPTPEAMLKRERERILHEEQNTLRALRILAWWETASRHPSTPMTDRLPDLI